MFGIWCTSTTKIFKTGWLHGWTFRDITFASREAAEAWLRNAFKDDRVAYEPRRYQ